MLSPGSAAGSSRADASLYCRVFGCELVLLLGLLTTGSSHQVFLCTGACTGACTGSYGTDIAVSMSLGLLVTDSC